MVLNTRKSPQSFSHLAGLIALIYFFHIPYAFSIDLPDKFEDLAILKELRDPASMAFAPDGSLFFGERITGRLRVALFNPNSGNWEVEPTPFYRFDVPSDRHRSAGLRGFCVDPNFAENGYVYAFYMKDNPRHNQVVRIQADPTNPKVALPGSEEVLLTLPFNSSTSSGSHNGGDMLIGPDGFLYFTTGDGWNGGDNVQSLSSYTGKLFRIHPNGDIPLDNPFYSQAEGNFRAIYCLGLRNPYTMALHPETGNIYINDAVGSKKATVYQVKADGSSAGDNFGHDGYSGLGNLATEWTNVSYNGKILVTGGTWYPQNGYWPEAYRGNYFAALWGSNSGDAGSIVRVSSESDLNKLAFASNVILPPRHKPVMTKIGPDGNLYYLLTDYETGNAEIHMIRYTGLPTVSAPEFSLPGGQYNSTIQVQIQSTTQGAQIYFTLDNSTPSQNASLYSSPITIDTSTTLRAIAYAPGLQQSNERIAAYRIGPVPNIPPIADAGPNLTAEVFSTVTLNGANSFDPDGSELELSESWDQLEGPLVEILDSDETVANFTPTSTGSYTFRITVADIQGASSADTVVITVVEEIPDILDNLLARWTMEAGSGGTIEDYSPNSYSGAIQGSIWSEDTPDQSAHSLEFDGEDDRVAIGTLDLTGTSMTLCLWYKADDWGVSDARFISKAFGQQDGEHLWMLSALQGDKLRYRLKTDGNTTTLIAPSETLTTGSWTHIAAVYDGAFMRLYQDGVQVAATPKTGTIDSDPNVALALGNQPEGVGGGQRPFDGHLDEVRIYGRALSEQEVVIVKNARPQFPPDSTPPNPSPVVHYTFEEQVGTTVFDRANSGTPLNMEIIAPNKVQWIIGGLELLQPTLLKALNPPDKIIDACRNTQAISMEAWITPQNYTQSGPARILSLSQTPFARNFTLGQEQNAYEARLRTTRSDNNGRPGLKAPPGNISLTKTHVVFTRKPNGQAAIFIDGVKERDFYRPGEFSNWNTNYEWILGNELTGDRPWLGILHEIAIYSEALEPDYIRQRYDQGKPEERFFALPINTQRQGELAPNIQLELSPNPAREYLLLSREIGNSPIEFSLINAQGKVVKSQIYMLGKRLQVALNTLSPGIYFLKGISTDHSFKEVFIKR
ncbi:MAG: LamG-like jellyroll fold domain-containing protein [Bacteroidota bacterium]